jgi:hypothetical protein
LTPTKVACANPQPLLATGRPCGWTGTRTGRRLALPGGRTVTLSPTHQRCPHCGWRVTEAQPAPAREKTR